MGFHALYEPFLARNAYDWSINWRPMGNIAKRYLFPFSSLIQDLAKRYIARSVVLDLLQTNLFDKWPLTQSQMNSFSDVGLSIYFPTELHSSRELKILKLNYCAVTCECVLDNWFICVTLEFCFRSSIASNGGFNDCILATAISEEFYAHSI